MIEWLYLFWAGIANSQKEEDGDVPESYLDEEDDFDPEEEIDE